MYSKSRSEKPVNPQSATTAVIPPPATPSKRVAKQQDQSNINDVFRTPGRSTDNTGDVDNNQHNTRQTNGQAPTASAAVNAAESQGQGQVQYVYAPSPSRLRALAASRSFSGSPNKKGGISEEQIKHASDNPVNLGKILVLPPTIDTPRTKAKRWLAGDTVSPPVKLKYVQSNGGSAANYMAPVASTSASAAASAPGPSMRNGRSAKPYKGDFWQQVDQARRSATPADEASLEKPTHEMQQPKNVDDVVMEDDENIIAPSPVKPKTVGKVGKGKQRQRFDLFNSNVEVPADSGRSTSTYKASSSNKAGETIPSKVSTNVSVAKFFTAKPNFTLVSQTEANSARSYVPGPSKPKKRAIAAVGLVPAISDDFDKIDVDEAPVAKEINNEEASLSKSRKAKGKAAVQANVHQEDAAVERAKRTRVEEKEASPAELQASADEDVDMNDAEEEALREVEREEADVDNYDTRDLSDEYGGPSLRRARTITPAIDNEEGRKSPSQALDESLDPELVSLLSLKASPVKNRLLKLQKKRETTYKKLLHEPTYLRQKQKQVKGLEDLDDEEEAGGLEQEVAQDVLWRGPADHTRETSLEGPEERSDDDWASEPEGWKDLSDGEMPDDSL